jgi:hypothetical protein
MTSENSLSPLSDANSKPIQLGHTAFSCARKSLDKDDGNVESALVLIPLLILFLIGVQLIVATNIRNTEIALAQGDASARAISHQFRSDDEVIEVGGGIEKIRILITHRTRLLPQLVPGLASLMGGNPVADVHGIAVIEPANS